MLLRRWWPVLLVLALFAGSMLWAWGSGTAAARAVPWSELVAHVEAGDVARIEVDGTDVGIALKDGSTMQATRLPGVDDGPLYAAAAESGAVVQGIPARSPYPWWMWASVLLLPLALIARSLAGRAGIGRAKAEVKASTSKVTFADVAGVDEAEAELVEIVEFLRSPDRFRALGATLPKGILLVGPPGTGKTLLARAVAGESGVPFYPLTGSEFVEMFVGVGAARIRELFAGARESTPCIIFIDELDAVGRSRGGLAALGANEEREQTLHQLLAEMDGFDPGAGLVVLAATNRPEILDPALVRAGRFDRQVVVDQPDVRGREDILRVHLRGVVLADDADPVVIARRTPGMVGADLAALVNEAALAAARRGGKSVSQADFEESIDRLQLGTKKRRLMSADEKRRVAFHEAGHALVASSVEHADPVHRVTIIPRSIGALGVTLQLPTQDRYLVTRGELLDQMCVMLGGRAAEALACADISTGAANDLERASETARLMVKRFGMSERLGVPTWGRADGLRFLDVPGAEQRDYSEETARAIDEEVRALVDAQAARAADLLAHQRDALTAIAERLLVDETLDGAALQSLLQAPRAAFGQIR